MNFLDELRWRGLLADISAGMEEHLRQPRCGYLGFDPTAASLHVGNLVPIMLLVHFQRAGHKPIALIGGATALIGDPSGKSDERPLLDRETVEHNQKAIEAQLRRFMDFSNAPNGAVLLNNQAWLSSMKLLDFLRDVGKHSTISYMMSKESVRARMDSGLSFTEFSYQLLQAYDFYYLSQHYGCTVQMGGADQWGNITAGIELSRKLGGPHLYGLTSPLLTRPDGKKFGKSEEGNVWLDARLTSPYRFYQFWINLSDEEAARCLRIFSLLPREEIEMLEQQHRLQPERRIIQEFLAKDLTTRVHSAQEAKRAAHTAAILFGHGLADELRQLKADDFEMIRETLPHGILSRTTLERGLDVIKLAVDETGFLSSRSEARRLLQSQGISVNKTPVTANDMIGVNHLLCDRYLLLQKGKKNYFLVVVE
ncbi:MAG: tyrosine--tRNA ligase [Chitinophagales bacterium]|nr:tyrosine--tRNA ligase [Chitinophagales bacterium]MDW8427968.1 tyrosine--tRNA ligase [Chitinophagales bacterium]